MDPSEATHAEQRRAHRRSGVAGRDHRTGLAISDQLGGAHERGVLLASNALSRVLVHADDLGARDQLQAQRVAHQLRWSHEDHVDAHLVDGLACSGDDLGGGLVTPHGIDDDRERPDRCQLSRPRSPGDPCTNRSSGRPRAGSWRSGSAGRRCATGPRGARPRPVGSGSSPSTSCAWEQPSLSSLLLSPAPKHRGESANLLARPTLRSGRGLSRAGEEHQA